MNPSIKRLGLLYHPGRAEAPPLACDIAAWLEAHGVETWRGQADAEEELRRAAPELDLLITLGGDGTIVRAARAMAVMGVPILGVNLGRLGFLAEVEPARAIEVLPALLAGRYFVEERMMLRAELRRAGEIVLAAEAINDVVVARSRASRTVRIAVDVDGHYVMTQTADGVIVSTPTGSTAYCLAAGGPIVAPDLDSMIITPIAAHLSLARAVVIPARRQLNLKLLNSVDAMLTVDGQFDFDLQADDEISHTMSDHKAKFVRFGDDGYFYETVLRRLRWPDQGPIP